MTAFAIDGKVERYTTYISHMWFGRTKLALRCLILRAKARVKPGDDISKVQGRIAMARWRQRKGALCYLLYCSDG